MPTLAQLRTMFAGGFLVAGCFSGDGTIGAACRVDGDCGNDQTCQSGVCGRCGDGDRDAGELCLTLGSERAVGLAPVDIAAADLDGDRVPDLVTVAPDAAPGLSVAVLPGVGDGFGAAQPVAVDGIASAAAIVDLDRDGALDLVVVGPDPAGSAGVLSVARGDGQLGFTVTQTLEAPADPTSVTVGDLDGDRRNDVAVAGAGTPGEVAVFVTADDGTLEPGGRFATGGDPRLGEPALLSGDGIVDLVTADALDGTVSLLVGLPDGGFERRPIDVGGRPIQVLVADGDGDGDRDLVVLDADGRLVVATDAGQGQFAIFESVTTDPDPRAVVVDDINLDATVDFIVAASAGVSVHLGRSSVHPDRIPMSELGARSLVLADVGRDGVVDLVVSRVDQGAVAVFGGEP